MHDKLARIATNMVGYGDITIGTTEVKVPIPECTVEVRIRADVSNTGIIFIGKTGVLNNKTNDYIRLAAGEEGVLPYNVVDNPLYAIADVAAQTINVGALI